MSRWVISAVLFVVVLTECASACIDRVIVRPTGTITSDAARHISQASACRRHVTLGVLGIGDSICHVVRLA